MLGGSVGQRIQHFGVTERGMSRDSFGEREEHRYYTRARDFSSRALVAQSSSHWIAGVLNTSSVASFL